ARAYPLRVCGGNLESTAVATSDPRGYSLAGLAPVPAAASIGLVIPNNDPITGTPVPDDVKEALKSFDFSNTPSQCQASYPPVTGTWACEAPRSTATPRRRRRPTTPSRPDRRPRREPTRPRSPTSRPRCGRSGPSPRPGSTPTAGPRASAR